MHGLAHPGGEGGFSLLELLVAISVFSVLAVIMFHMVTATGTGTRISNRAADAAAQARLALDRIGADTSLLVRRDDADFFARSADPLADAAYDPANLMLFLATVSSPGLPVLENRGVSLVAYRLAAHADTQGRPCLLRAGMAIPWTAPAAWGMAGFMGENTAGLPVRLSATDPRFAQTLLPGVSDFDVLAGGVIAVAVGYQLCPDDQSVTLKDGSTTSTGRAQGQIVYSPPVRGLSSSPSGDYIDIRRISSLVIGVVSLDLESLRLLSVQDTLALAAAFAPPDVENQLPVKFWMDHTSGLAALPASVPLAARQAVRVFQRYFPVTPFGEQPQ